MWIIKHKTIFLVLSSLLIVGALAGFFIRGLNVGVEFTGGSVLELSYETAPDIAQLHTALDTLEYPVQLQPFGETGVIVRTRDITEAERQELITILTPEGNTSSIERFNTVGPSVGKELRAKAILALVVVMLAIIVFVAWAFRSPEDEDEDENQKTKKDTKEKQRRGPSSWSYGFIAVAALLHDIIIPTGIFIWLGLEINSLFIVGLLSILGLSVNDTIVVFDRIREKVRLAESDPRSEISFDRMVGESITETMSRSINTSLTLFVVLIALYVVGPAATQDLALVMILGMLVGTYSSIFLASPLLVVWQKIKGEK